jgi:hypothetical protein
MPKPLPRDQPCASHDVKMGRVAVAVRLALRRAPAFIPCVRAQIRDHDGDGLARARTGALAGWGVALVREVVAGAAAAATPGSFAAYGGEEGGGA